MRNFWKALCIFLSIISTTSHAAGFKAVVYSDAEILCWQFAAGVEGVTIAEAQQCLMKDRSR